MAREIISPIGRLPADWRILPLKQLAKQIGSGATPRGGSAVYLVRRSNYAIVRSQNVFDRSFNDEGLAFISDSDADTLRGVALEPDDVLFNITGDGITFARACLVPTRILPACVNQHVVRIRCDKKKCDPAFLVSFLTHPLAKEYIESFNAGGSRRAITKGHIESFCIPVPPLNEQRAIGCILGALDDKIELNRRMNRTLEGMARGIFQSWFVDFDPVHAKAAGRKPPGLSAPLARLFPATLEDSELGKIPKGWTVGKLGQIIEIYDSKRIPLSSRERLARQGSYRYYGAAGVIDYVDDYLFDGVHVLVGEDGTVLTDAGNPVVQYVWGKFWVNNHAHVLTGSNGVSSEHLYLLLKQVNAQPFVTGAVQLKLSQGSMKSVPIVHAPPSVNAEFSRCIRPVFEKSSAIYDESKNLASLRNTLLPKLISGELRVPDAERIVARTV